MKKELASLTETLGQEVSLYTDMLSLVERTQQALVNNNIDELSKLLDSKQMLISQAAKFEEGRQQQLEQIIKLLKLDNEGQEVNLTTLIAQVPAEFAEQLTKIQQNLQSLVDKINQQNKQNEILIKDSLKFIDYSMELMTGGSDNQTYDRQQSGVEKKGKGKSVIFDQKV